MPPTASILIVEDDPQQLWLYSRALRDYRLTCVQTASAALEILRTNPPDLVLLDNVLGGGELGSEFLPRLKDAAAHVPIIMISGTLDLPAQLRALQGPRSASFLVTKPVDLAELERTVEVALTECGMGEAVRMIQSLERVERSDPEDTPDRRYVERLTRQHDLLKGLRASGQVANISALSRQYGVSRRTIARDLEELVTRGQLPAALCPESPKESAGSSQES
jgi:DNA-binding NtrC family response regulator